MKRASIVFRSRARTDLLELYEFIAAEAGLHRAGIYVDRIVTACLSLATFPERGTRRDDLAPGLRTIGFERRATIVFRVEEDTVEIVAVAYGGRDFESGWRDE